MQENSNWFLQNPWDTSSPIAENYIPHKNWEISILVTKKKQSKVNTPLSHKIFQRRINKTENKGPWYENQIRTNKHNADIRRQIEVLTYNHISHLYSTVSSLSQSKHIHRWPVVLLVRHCKTCPNVSRLQGCNWVTSRMHKSITFKNLPFLAACQLE